MLHDMFSIATHSVEQARALSVHPVQADKIESVQIGNTPLVARIFGRLAGNGPSLQTAAGSSRLVRLLRRPRWG